MAYFAALFALLVLAASLFLGLLMNDGSTAPSVQQYYTSLESRLGYLLLLGNARHCGYWAAGTWWPFPIDRAQRAMEEKLYQRLGLEAGSRVLDAGAGSGVVGSYMAKKGLVIEGVDLTPLHVQDAQRVIQAQGLRSDQITVRQGNYHDISDVKSESFDGVYTMETFVHADNPSKVLQNFRRILRPGGVIVLHEADCHWDSDLLQEILRLSHCPSTLKAGAYESLLKEAGFIDITVQDYTDNVLPLWRLFGIIGSVPYDLMRLIGVQDRFTNVMAGVEIYRHWGQVRYISVKGTNP